MSNAHAEASPPPSEGERTTPDDPAQNLIYQGHLAVHRFGHRRLRRDAAVLDLGCGEGYGAAALAERSRFCVAVDCDFPSVRAAARKYVRRNLAFVVADASHLPFRFCGFDTVWCVEMIEHLPAPEACVAEVDRVLADGGLYFLSTPNRLVSSPAGVTNPFHFREYDPGELEALLSGPFREVDVRGLYLTYFLSARRRALAAVLLAIQRLRIDRWLPPPLLHRLFRLGFRMSLSGDRWNRENRADHWQPAPLGAIGQHYCLDLLAVSRK